MKRLFAIFVAVFILTPSLVMGDIVVNKKTPTIKKASAVSSSQTGGLSGGLQAGMGILQTVTGFINDVKQLKKEQRDLSAGCEPTSGEVQLVNDLVKEWAKVADTTRNGAEAYFNGWDTHGDDANDYRNCMEDSESNVCYRRFLTRSDSGKVWEGFPRADKDKLSNGKVVSNMYDIFGRIPFVPNDYTKSELKQVKSLIEKSQKCAPDVISGKKKEIWGSFLVNTINKVGTSTGASGVSDVMGMVQSMGANGGGGVSGMFSTFGGQALKAFDK